MSAQPVSILLCALGGEGGGVLSGWLVAAARAAGLVAQATSIPGVAQRTGATTYYLEILPQPIPAGSQPVLGLNPLPGRLDLLVSSELLETVRQVASGMVSASRTKVISNASRVLTTNEKMVPGDGRVDDSHLQSVIAKFSRTHHLVAMSDLTREARTVISAVMLGCIAASGALPLRREHFESAILGDGTAAQASRQGFELGYAAVAGPATVREANEPTPQSAAPALAPDIAERFPVATHRWIALGLDRLREYQGQAYCDLYLRRVTTVWDAEQTHSLTPGAAPVTTETARWLALWMAFDDVIRVADLKSRRERLERVGREVGATPDDVLRVYDHFKPGIPEFAGLLPEGLAQKLLRWERKRVAAGHAPWALPLKVATHSVSGWLALKGLAALRFSRPWGSRYRSEQRLIDRWVQSVCVATGESWKLGLELARCGRLIKGYGSTNERGKRNLEHLLSHVTQISVGLDERWRALATLREAALKDEAGRALDKALHEQGMPPRPVETRPVLWHKNPRSIKQ